jgi:hypothetical protein
MGHVCPPFKASKMAEPVTPHVIPVSARAFEVIMADELAGV